MSLSDVLLLNYNTDIEAYYIILTGVILKNEQRAPRYSVSRDSHSVYLQPVSPY